MTEKRSVKPWDILNPSKHHTTDEEADKRYNICKECPEFISATKQCKKCGCFMAIKVKFEEAFCPVGKW